MKGPFKDRNLLIFIYSPVLRFFLIIFVLPVQSNSHLRNHSSSSSGWSSSIFNINCMNHIITFHDHYGNDDIESANELKFEHNFSFQIIL